MINLTLYAWQILQNLLGLLVIWVLKKAGKTVTPSELKGRAQVYRVKNWRQGVSLGRYIIIAELTGSATVNHEYGHTKQSMMLGPLYLLVVGLPSVIMNVMSTVLYMLGNHAFLANYYNRWPESWADKLGGVKR